MFSRPCQRPTPLVMAIPFLPAPGTPIDHWITREGFESMNFTLAKKQHCKKVLVDEPYFMTYHRKTFEKMILQTFLAKTWNSLMSSRKHNNRSATSLIERTAENTKFRSISCFKNWILNRRPMVSFRRVLGVNATLVN